MIGIVKFTDIVYVQANWSSSGKVRLTSLFKKSSTLLVVLLYATTCKAKMKPAIS